MYGFIENLTGIVFIIGLFMIIHACAYRNAWTRRNLKLIILALAAYAVPAELVLNSVLSLEYGMWLFLALAIAAASVTAMVVRRKKIR